MYELLYMCTYVHLQLINICDTYEYISIYTYVVYVHVYVWVYIYIYMNVGMFVCTHVCLYL